MSYTKSGPLAKRAKADYTTYITVLVGLDEKPFIVHEGIIVHHSPFFRAACSGEFKESKERLVRLPEVKAEVFQILLHWVYTKELVTLEPNQICEDVATGFKRTQAIFVLFARVYALADQLDIRELRNKVIDEILALSDKTWERPGVNAITTTFSHTLMRSPLRRLARDFYLHGVVSHLLMQHRDILPADFIFGLALAAGHQPKDKPMFRYRCKYHEHDEGEPKCI